MKKIFSLIALGSFALVTADQYYQGYGDGYDNAGYCPQGYYSTDDRNVQQNTGYGYQQAPQNQYYQYDRNQPNTGYQQQAPQNQYYQYDRNQNDRNQYDRNVQQNTGYGYQQQASQNQYQQSGNQSYYDMNQQRNNTKAVSDQEINKNIRDALSSGWFSRGYDKVTFDVNNGNVTLRGNVDTQENKNKVEERVKKIEGVRQVNNQITISKEIASNYSDSDLQTSERKYSQDKASTIEDRQLNARIRDKISNGWFSKNNQTLIIRTANGMVVISGTVEKPEDIQKINDQVKEIEGVRSVNTQLTVKNR